MSPELLASSCRYIMVAKVSDASGEAWVSTFNDQAEKIIGCSADELDKIKSQVGNRLLNIVHIFRNFTNCLSSIGINLLF